MEKGDSQELLKKMDSMNKSLVNIAEAMSVFKVALIATIISALVVIWKNFMR